MPLAAEAARFRRLCDVHLERGGGVAPMAVNASSCHAQKGAAA
jgi:hypothetical protein